MAPTWHEINEAVTQDHDFDPAKCSCGGLGWVVSDYDTWHMCPSHPHRVHPEIEGGRFPTLWVEDRMGRPRTIHGDVSKAVYDNSPNGLDVARRDARRLQDRFAQYGFRVILRWMPRGE